MASMAYFFIYYFADLEERGLHYCIDTRAKTDLLGDTDGVNNEEFRLLVDQLLLGNGLAAYSHIAFFVIRRFQKKTPPSLRL